jgi:hypothetical protein
MGCIYNGGDCHGLVPCHRCRRCPYPVERVKYPSERTVFVASLRGFLN